MILGHYNSWPRTKNTNVHTSASPLRSLLPRHPRPPFSTASFFPVELPLITTPAPAPATTPATSPCSIVKPALLETRPHLREHKLSTVPRTVTTAAMPSPNLPRRSYRSRPTARSRSRGALSGVPIPPPPLLPRLPAAAVAMHAFYRAAATTTTDDSIVVVRPPSVP